MYPSTHTVTPAVRTAVPLPLHACAAALTLAHGLALPESVAKPRRAPTARLLCSNPTARRTELRSCSFHSSGTTCLGRHVMGAPLRASQPTPATPAPGCPQVTCAGGQRAEPAADPGEGTRPRDWPDQTLTTLSLVRSVRAVCSVVALRVHFGHTLAVPAGKGVLRTVT